MAIWVQNCGAHTTGHLVCPAQDDVRRAFQYDLTAKAAVRGEAGLLFLLGVSVSRQQSRGAKVASSIEQHVFCCVRLALHDHRG